MKLSPLEERVEAAVTPIIPELAENAYTGNAREYCTWNETGVPRAFGDGRAHLITHLVQVHLFLPLKTRPYAKKRALRRALMNTPGFTAPTVTDASDLAGQHYVFEFEAIGGMY